MVDRAFPRFVAAGSSNVNLSAVPSLVDYSASAPAAALRITIHDATATETPDDVNKRLELYCPASSHISGVGTYLQFNTGVSVSCAGNDGGVTVYLKQHS